MIASVPGIPTEQVIIVIGITVAKGYGAALRDAVGTSLLADAAAVGAILCTIANSVALAQTEDRLTISIDVQTTGRDEVCS